MPLQPGERLGPYEILALIGAGGMGEVYKAHDPRLRRNVAIKVSAAQFSERFAQEAQTIAALNHSHICQVYDVGTNYLVMEFIEGIPLAGPLALDLALRYALQICDALDAAHQKNVTHRDLKPANILVTASGIKLLDFGLAKVAAAQSPEGTTQTMPFTEAGAVMGTAAYMSPEQARGEEVDARSDIFSFGLVLYEMLSGCRAFARNSFVETMSAILRDEPPVLDAPANVSSIVARCLRKSPADRFQTMSEVRLALQQPTTKSAEKQPSIAVLPFANMSAEKENEYFSDGLAEEILNLLAKIPDLKVMARTSSFAFRGKEQDITKIAEILRVRNILEGSVRKAGNRIRVNAQLINAMDGTHLWSERYDRELTDIFAVQDEIAEAIAKALHVKLAAKPDSKPRYQPSLPAYEAFLRGRRLIFMGAPLDLARAKECLDQAVTLDPQYPDAWAELGMYYYLQSQVGTRAGTEVLPLARSAAAKALDLAPADPRAHVVLGLVAAFLDFDWKTADEHIQRAKATGHLAPEVRVRCTLILLPRGRFTEVIQELESVVAEDPLAVLPRTILALDLFLAGQYDRSEAEAKIAMEFDQVIWAARYVIGLSYAVRGRLGEAREWSEQAVRVSPWSPHCVALLAGVLERLGESERASELLAPLRSHPTRLFTYHVVCSNLDAAADCCEAAIAQCDPFPLLCAEAGFTEPLRQSPRWAAIARKLNLPAA